MTARNAPPLAPDLVAGLKRLKLARVRAMAPETLQQAKTQRWTPEELLRTFVEAEIAARDAANQRLRHKAAGFPVHKSLEEFKVTASSVPQATFDYLASLEWVRAAENLCLVGPAGTGKSHCETGLGDHGACRQGIPRRRELTQSLIGHPGCVPWCGAVVDAVTGLLVRRTGDRQAVQGGPLAGWRRQPRQTRMSHWPPAGVPSQGSVARVAGAGPAHRTAGLIRSLSARGVTHHSPAAR